MPEPVCTACGKKHQSTFAKVYEPIILRLAKPIQKRRQYIARQRLADHMNKEGWLQEPKQMQVQIPIPAPARTPSTPPQA